MFSIKIQKKLTKANLINMKIPLSEFIKYIYNQDRDTFLMNSEIYFEDENEAKLFLNRLSEFDIITFKSPSYGSYLIKKGSCLYKVAADFDFNLEQYEKSITRKEELEIENLQYQANERANNEAIRELTKKNLQLSTENLKLQSWDIKYRWLMSFITGILGFIIEYKTSIIKIIVQAILR